MENDYGIVDLPVLTLLEFQVIQLRMLEYLETPMGKDSYRNVTWCLDTYRRVFVAVIFNVENNGEFKGYKLLNRVRI